MRLSRDGGRTYPRRHEQDLAMGNPGQPVTVPVYNAATGTGRLIAADFDVSRARAAGADDAAGLVAAEAAGFAALITRLGGWVITDVSPSGERHVLVLLAAALPWRELRDLARALALRYQTLDPAPMAGPGGQIRPPGARHRTGGWQALTMSLEAAVAAVERPCGPQVWAGPATGRKRLVTCLPTPVTCTGGVSMTIVHAAASRVQVWIMPTNEEIVVARQAQALLQSQASEE